MRPGSVSVEGAPGMPHGAVSSIPLLLGACNPPLQTSLLVTHTHTHIE